MTGVDRGLFDNDAHEAVVESVLTAAAQQQIGDLAEAAAGDLIGRVDDQPARLPRWSCWKVFVLVMAQTFVFRTPVAVGYAFFWDRLDIVRGGARGCRTIG